MPVQKNSSDGLTYVEFQSLLTTLYDGNIIYKNGKYWICVHKPGIGMKVVWQKLTDATMSRLAFHHGYYGIID